MTRRAKQKIISSIGGTLYIVLTLEWLWLLMLYFERLTETKIAELVFPTHAIPTETLPADPMPPLPLNGPFSPLFVGFALLVALAIIVAAGYVIARVYVPGVHRVARETVQKTAEVSVGHAIKHHVVPAKERRKLTARVLFWIKSAACLFPVVIVFLLPGSITPHMPTEIARAGVLFFALIGFVLAVIQHLLMRRWRVRET